LPRACLLAACLALVGIARGEALAVRYTEGVVHGFLALRTLDGEVIARGDLSQVARGDRVSAHLTFEFNDGSRHEESVTFSQRGKFRLLSERLSQRGPTFPHETDLRIDAVKGTVNGMPLAMPADVANGLVSILMKNIPDDRESVTMALVVSTSKPRLADVTIARDGEDRFSVGGSQRSAARYRVKVRLRGMAGVAAAVAEKEPPDYHVWIMKGEAPVFLKSEGPLYFGGPVWRIELASPSWTQAK